MYEIVTFFLARGTSLNDLINANAYEKIMYSLSKEKYVNEETEKYKALFDGK